MCYTVDRLQKRYSGLSRSQAQELCSTLNRMDPVKELDDGEMKRIIRFIAGDSMITVVLKEEP